MRATRVTCRRPVPVRQSTHCSRGCQDRSQKHMCLQRWCRLVRSRVRQDIARWRARRLPRFDHPLKTHHRSRLPASRRRLGCTLPALQRGATPQREEIQGDALTSYLTGGWKPYRGGSDGPTATLRPQVGRNRAASCGEPISCTSVRIDRVWSGRRRCSRAQGPCRRCLAADTSERQEQRRPPRCQPRRCSRCPRMTRPRAGESCSRSQGRAAKERTRDSRTQPPRAGDDRSRVADAGVAVACRTGRRVVHRTANFARGADRVDAHLRIGWGSRAVFPGLRGSS